uniref:TFIIS N-terminal domain-containing protein n=1 Tax=Anopheles gambiae TaxID=7165 RepID=A0A1S4GZY7_ANOGA
MPRIDPMKLLVCLSVLLAPNGGIRNAGEVRRLANLMAKFSKKLVSKAIYIQILKCTETELLGQFMQTGGWSLVHMWLVDGIGSKNWPLIQELMELLLCCPVDVERLKINSTPRLVKSLSTDSANESVKVLASKLVEQWLYIVKAPKQLSPMVPINQSELPAITGLAGTADGKQTGAEAAIGQAPTVGAAVVGKQGVADIAGKEQQHYQRNGYGSHAADSGEVDGQTETANHDGMVDGDKTTFQPTGEAAATVVPAKKTSLVLKITTKNGKQVVAKVIKSSTSRKGQRDSADGRAATDGEGAHPDDGDEEEDDDDDEEDQEEVVVNIESSKPSGEEATVAAPVAKKDDQLNAAETKKVDVVANGGTEGSKERNSSSSKDKDRHNHSHHRDREREKDRKGSSSSRSSSSKTSSSSSSSSSKHKSSSSSSSKSSSSSSSRSKDKDRHGSSSSSSGSKHKSSSSSSSSKSGSSSSKSSSSSSDKHRDKDKSSSGGSRDGKESKAQSASPKLARARSRDDSVGCSNDSGSETSSVTNTSANDSKVAKSTTIPSKKASISIEVRNPENRVKTVKTYNSQFRSHGLIEEAPPPPSRKGLKKPSSASSPSTASPAATAASNNSSGSSSTVIGSTATGTLKRSSPTSSSGRDAVLAGVTAEKRAKEDPMERPGSIKLIPPKRQHALVESDMFMDALSATLRKDVKKRKRRTSGSEGATAGTATAPSSKPTGETTTTTSTTTATTAAAGSKPAGSDASTTAKANAPGSSPTRTEEHAAETTAPTPTTPTSPKVPTIAPMSFYRDTLAEQEEETGTEPTAGEDGEKKKDQAESDSTPTSNGDGAEEKKPSARKSDDTPGDEDGGDHADDDDDDDDEGPVLKKSKRAKCELNEDDDEEKGAEGEEKKVKKEGETVADDKTELMDVVMSDVEKKIALEAESGVKKEEGGTEKEEEDGKKPPGPGCGPDGPPGVLVIHRRKGPKKQLRWRAAEELEEVRYFELDVTERCNVTKSFTDMKQMERVDERQKFMLSRKVGSEDIMVERTAWRPLLQVDNVPPSPDGSQSLERNVQRQRERGCLQALYFNKHMIPDSPAEPDPADTYQTADPVHIPLEDVTGNPDSVNDFTSMPWPDPRSTPPHESGAFSSPFFPSDLPPGAGFGAGGFPPPFAPGAAATIGPGPWNLGVPVGAPGVGAGGPRAGVLPPGMFPLSQPPPGLVGQPAAGGSPNMLNLPLSMSPNVPPPGMFPGANNFNAPPPELGVLAAGGVPDMGGRRGDGFRNGPPPHQQWTAGGNRPFGGGGNNNPNRGGGGGGFGNRGGGGNWNNRNQGNNNNNGNGNRNGDRSRIGDDGRGNFRGHWLQGGNRGHNNNRGGGGGRKW